MICGIPLGVLGALMTSEQRKQMAQPGRLIGHSETKVAAAIVRDHRTGESHLVPVVAVDIDPEATP